MATKVALTAEEFRENSQRSIALFNTEKLSTDSTHVLKSAYCNSVHFCRCNLHGACGGKGPASHTPARPVRVAICTERVEAKSLSDVDMTTARRCNLHGACGGKALCAPVPTSWRRVAICTERVEAKLYPSVCRRKARRLQSARSVWRQRFRSPSRGLDSQVAICTERVEAKVVLPENVVILAVAICTERVEAKRSPSRGLDSQNMLQSARSVWRQRVKSMACRSLYFRCNLHGACGGKGHLANDLPFGASLQSARSVWRQR